MSLRAAAFFALAASLGCEQSVQEGARSESPNANPLPRVMFEPVEIAAHIPRTAPEAGAPVAIDGGGSTDAGRYPVPNADAVIRADLHPGAAACYRGGARLHRASVDGRVVITMSIAATGAVDEAVASQCTLLPRACACMESRALRLKFAPPPNGGATLHAPMNFVSDGWTPRTLEERTMVVFLREVSPSALKCYRAALANEPTLEGAATFYARVARDGRISVSADPDPKLTQALLTCVADAFSRATFPLGIELHAPLDFRISR